MPLETILVVDDKREVVELVALILRRAGFDVLTAVNGPEAVKLSDKTSTRIDLLLSDWDMPVMSGPALGETLKKMRPDIHVMLMSGGVGDSLMILNYGWAFIEKPFLNGKLVDMVNAVLHTPNRSQPGGEEFDSRKDGTGYPVEDESPGEK